MLLLGLEKMFQLAKGGQVQRLLKKPHSVGARWRGGEVSERGRVRERRKN